MKEQGAHPPFCVTNNPSPVAIRVIMLKGCRHMLSLFTLFQTWPLEKIKFDVYFPDWIPDAYENATSPHCTERCKMQKVPRVSRELNAAFSRKTHRMRFGANYMPDPNEIMQIRRREILRASGGVRDALHAVSS
jgi:hypothetical protein